MNCLNNFDISVIQGDFIELYFVLANLDTAQIQNVYFTCAKQNLKIDCPYSELNKGYCLRMDSSVTKSFLKQISSYDLTIKFIDGNSYTIIYNNLFIVLAKQNKISEE